MNLLRRIARRIGYLFRRHSTEAEMAEEMRFHLEQRTAELEADGLSAEEARYAAQRKFGNTASIEEQARDAWGWGWLERLAKDLRFAFRQLVRSPGFSILAIVTLGLGIGANTSMFSALNGVVFKQLPYANLDQLDRIYRVTPQNAEGNMSPADFLELQKSSDTYGDYAASAHNQVSLSDPGQPAQQASAARATANFFSMLGVQPQLGRGFLPGEGAAGLDRVAVLSQRIWLNRYGGAEDIVGRTVRIDGQPHQIVGVLPASFNDWRHLGYVDFFRPLAFTPEIAVDRKTTNLQVIGRRAPGVSLQDGAAFIESVGIRLAQEFPEFNAESSWRTVTLQSTAAGSGGVTVMPMLVALSAFVLLIACSNLANFLLARTMARAREFAVRAALGASRLQLLRPLIAESLLLSIAGGGLAIVVALWFSDWAAVRSTGDNGEQVTFDVNWLVMGWAFLASLVTAVAFGLAPALFALRLNLNDTLKSGGRGATGGRGHQRFRQVLIVGQFALAMVLLSGAALFIRGLDELHDRRAGWESAQVVTGSIVLPSGTYGDAEKISAFQRLMLERLGTLPGVASVSVATATPFFHWSDIRKFHIEGHERPPAGKEPAAMVNTISPQFFETFGMRIVAGRDFTERDNATATKVYLVSESTARAYFGDANPIGRRLAPAGGNADLDWGEVVGVIADFQPNDPDPSLVVHHIYVVMAQEPQRQFELAVRAENVAPSALVASIRATMTDLDADLPVRRLQPADKFIARMLYQLGVLRDMLTAFGALGLGLASIGIYGIIARTMAQRTGEFAIRIALGASVRNLTRLVLASGVKLALVGSALGLFGAFGVSSIIAAAFPGIRTDNLLVLAGTTFLLVAIALLACWLPARRAGKVNPVDALRAE
ncbi:MAG TPA: ABC transporter permease [Opitutaceae bacterium]|nr:ABC transporter permease [Opitutaceae bacterium]